MWQILKMLKSRGVIGVLNFLFNMNDRAFIMLVAHTYHKNAALELCVTSVPSKKSPNVYKSCPKMKDFDIFTKIALECGRFGQNNFCQRL